jgi:hypothetical protein
MKAVIPGMWNVCLKAETITVKSEVEAYASTVAKSWLNEAGLKAGLFVTVTLEK